MINQATDVSRKAFRYSKGFTVTELLITCGIVSLLSLFASNSLDIINTKRLNNLTTDIYQMVQSSRTFALQYKKFVIICPTADMQTCANRWSSAALSFIDLNGNKTLDDDEQIISTVSTPKDFANFRWVAFGNKTNLAFSAEGYTDNQNGRFYICREEKGKSIQRQILVHKSGRPRVAAPLELKHGYCKN